MLVYLFSLLSSCVLAIAVKNKRLQYRNKTYSLLWVAMIPLGIVSALRYRVGTDYTVYLENQFQFILNLRQPDYWQVLDYEVGFEKLVEFCGKYLGNVEFFFPIVSILFLVFVTLYISEQSESITLSIALLIFTGFYNFSFNIIRQTLATAIFLYALKYVQERRGLKYVICILVATTFHKTAIIYLPIYFIANFGLNTIFRFISLTLTYIGIYFLTILLVPEKERMTQTGKLFSLLETLSIIAVLCGSIAQESTRIIYMFFPIYIVSIPYWFNRFKKNKIGIIGKCLILLLVIYLYIYYIPINNYGDTLPYQTIFRK